MDKPKLRYFSNLAGGEPVKEATCKRCGRDALGWIKRRDRMTGADRWYLAETFPVKLREGSSDRRVIAPWQPHKCKGNPK